MKVSIQDGTGTPCGFRDLNEFLDSKLFGGVFTNLPGHWKRDENLDQYTTSFDVPGIPKESISLKYDNGTLNIDGTSGEEHNIDLRVNIPKDADPGKITAEQRDGVLYIKVKIKEDQQSKTIPIK